LIHYLVRKQTVHAGLDRVWEFFSDPGNLNEITPPDMNFEIIAGGEKKMYAGQLIEYRVEFIRGIRSLWLTEITQVREKEYFVDEQRIGPYRFWYHEHLFETVDGGVLVGDKVSYAIPFGLLGELVHLVYIKKRLDEIFNFRREKVAALFDEL
jgi:ligand-binding SRPBCC domain-containing protein